MRSPRSLLVTLLVVLVAMQIVRPARPNPPADPKRTIDCHSNGTVWPWWTQVAGQEDQKEFQSNTFQSYGEKGLQ